MEQLNGLDGMFLYIEQPGLPMTITSVAIYDPSTAPDGKVRFKDILQTFENGIPKASVFRRRLVDVPGDLDHPYWIDDPDFDMEFHVRHIALPKPGDWRQFFIQLSRLQARMLDRSRPLWEAYIIEGLNALDGIPPGSFAVMLKVHHAAMDGRTGINMFLAMHDFEPKRPSVEVDLKSLPHEHRPKPTTLLTNTVKNYASRALGSVSMARHNLEVAWRVQQAKRSGKIHNVEGKVHTRFNHEPSAYRAITCVHIPKDQCQLVRELVPESTLNDVMLAVISGGLRKYLQLHDELPEHTLVAGCPIDVRNDSNRNVEHNLVSIMNVALCTQYDNPLRRFKAVHAEAHSAKNYHAYIGGDMVNSVTQILPPNLLKWGVKGFMKMVDHLPIVQNTVITNVPGAEVPVYFAGAQMVDGFGLGPVMPHCTLFHAISGVMNNMTLSVTACRKAMPDPEVYQRCLEESWQELYACVEHHHPTKAKPHRKPRARKVRKAEG